MGYLSTKTLAKCICVLEYFMTLGRRMTTTRRLALSNTNSCCLSKMNFRKNSRIETHLASDLRRAMMVREKEKALCALDDVEIVFELTMQCLQLDELGLQNDNETSQEKCAT